MEGTDRGQNICNEKRGRNSFTPTMLLTPTFRVTRLRNSRQFFLTQCLLSAFRITPPASPVWSFYSLFSSYANHRYSYIRNPQTHIPLFFFSRRSNADAMSNLFHYFLYYMPPWSLMITSQYIVLCPDWHSTFSLQSLHCYWFIFIALWPSTYIIYVDHTPQI